MNNIALYELSNEYMQALEIFTDPENDMPIDRLFAAGSAGQGGLLLKGHGHHVGWAFISGRIAGRHAADTIRKNTPDD